MNKSSPSLKYDDFADTDLCVLCGMCTPHCPTYRIYQIEPESPRGRISLIQALASQTLIADDKTLTYLNHCLGCRNCETICPSRVPFMALMDKARQLTAEQHKLSTPVNKLLEVIKQPDGLNRHQKLLNFVKHSGLTWLTRLLPSTSSLAKSADLLKQGSTGQFKDFYPAQNQPRGAVALFTGCMGAGFNSDTLHSGIHLLNVYGFDVHIPGNQQCCGALHQHKGQMHTATELLTKNRTLFEQYNLDGLLYFDSGCGTQLAQLQSKTQVFSITQFILHQIQPEPGHFKPCNKTIWLHESCSLRNSLKQPGITRQLISLVPDMTIKKLNHADQCCGAGGSNFVEYPELADQLRDSQIDILTTDTDQLLVSDNIGCSLHFKTGLASRNLKIEVIHPVTLLARQLK